MSQIKQCPYKVAETCTWFRVEPATINNRYRMNYGEHDPHRMNYGEHDPLTLVYSTSELAEGVHTGRLTLVALGGLGSNHLDVVMNVIPRPRFRLNTLVLPSNTGVVTTNPPPGGDGKFEQGTMVGLRAFPAADYEFHYWQDNTNSTSDRYHVTVMGTETVTARFRIRTFMSGVVTNRISGTPIEGAIVCFGLFSTRTGADGAYRLGPMMTAQPGFKQALQTGYLVERPQAFTPVPNHDNKVNFGLTPDFIHNVRAWVQSGTKNVCVRYDFTAPSNAIPAISMQVSSVGGAVWDVPVNTLEGDVGAGVTTGGTRMVVWDAGVDWNRRVSDQMVVRLSANGCTVTSDPFLLDTRGSRNWRLRPWADRNRNGRYDAGEQRPGAEVYFDQSRLLPPIGTTDAQGLLTVASEAVYQKPIFIRSTIFTQAAAKGGHAAVDNTMYKLWMDSDLGGSDVTDWDGEWRSYKLSAADMATIDQGGIVNVQLTHPVFDWNLMVAVESDSADFIADLRTGFGRASASLWDATDGQMKFGKVRIDQNVAQGVGAWTNADVVIFSQNSFRPSARTGTIGIASPAADGTLNNIQHGLTENLNGDGPLLAAYYRGLVHEFSHYAFNVRDEYEDASQNQFNWTIYRNANPDLVPPNYGIMDLHTTITELSSFNDYLASYPAAVAASNVTEHAFNRYLSASNLLMPCWQVIQLQFERSYSNTVVEIVVPQYGFYSNGVSTSQDRPGPTLIMPPYKKVDIWTSARGWDPILFSEGETPPTGVAGPVRISVTKDGGALAGASTFVRGGGRRPRLRDLGKSGSDGTLLDYDLQAGDLIQVYWQGLRLEHKVLASERSLGYLTLDLDEAPALGLASTGTVGPSAAGDLGLLVTPMLYSSTGIVLQVSSSKALASPPQVVQYPNNTGSNAVVMTLSGSNTWQGAMALSPAAMGSVEITCQAADGDSLFAFDRYRLSTIPAGEDTIHSSFDGYAEFNFSAGDIATDTPLLIYSSNARLILPAGTAQTNQIGNMHVICLPQGTSLTYPVALNLYYQDADMAGFDESTAALYWWDPLALAWTLASATIADGINIASAAITNTGHYVILADTSADTNAPALITDFTARTGNDPWTVLCNWTAPGDDGTNGAAQRYVLVYGTDSNLSDRAEVYLPITPQAAGTPEQFRLVLPAPGALYYLAIQARDEAGNLSDLSDLAAARSQMLDANGDGLPDQWLNSADTAQGGTMLSGDDADGDGLTTWDEYLLGTDPTSADSDGDYMDDQWEADHGLNPLDATDADRDDDGDGLLNSVEHQYGTNPLSADTDGDLMRDDWEIEHQLDPLTAAGGYGGSSDNDADGVVNQAEFVADTDPLNANDFFAIADARQTPTNAYFTFAASARRLYQIQYTTNLLHGTWTAERPFFYGNAATETVVITNTQNRMYKINVTTPQ